MTARELFDRLIRYLPVIDYIKKNKPERILEVGSSSKGLGEFWDGNFTGVDMDFPEKPVSNMKAVRGSVENLPFEDAEFDLVFSIDMFEHLEENVRGKALKEMLRVSKGAVIVGYPCGRGAEKLSKKMLDWFEKSGSGTARWMREHVENGLPESIDELTNLRIYELTNKKIRKNPLEIRKNRLENNLTIQQFNNENLFVCEWLLKLEENPRFLKLERYILMHFRSKLEFILRRLNFSPIYRKIVVIETLN